MWPARDRTWCAAGIASSRSPFASPARVLRQESRSVVTLGFSLRVGEASKRGTITCAGWAVTLQQVTTTSLAGWNSGAGGGSTRCSFGGWRGVVLLSTPSAGTTWRTRASALVAALGAVARLLAALTVRILAAS